MSGNRSLWTVGLLLLFAAVYFYQDPEWNGNSRLDLTRAIVERGTLRIDGYPSQHDWATEDLALYNGHYYSDKAIGSSLFAVPFYFLIFNLAAALHLQLESVFIKHILTALVLAPALAINGIVMYRLAGKLGASPRRSLIATLAIALGTMLWPYSAVYYGHALTAAFLIICFYLLFSMSRAPETIRPMGFFMAGLAMGLGFITEYTAAFIIPGLLVYAAFALRGQSAQTILRSALAVGAGALIPLSPMLAYNYSVFGNPLALGYSYEASNTFQQGMSLGLMGIHLPHRSVLVHITLDPKFGLFWQSPILALAPFGYFMSLKRREYRVETMLSLYAVGAMLLMNAGYYLWWGGHAFGPRLIIPCLSFFIVPLALLPAVLDVPAVLLTTLSIGQMLIPLVGQIQMAVDFKERFNAFFVEAVKFDGFSILYQHGLPLILQRLQDGIASWTLGTALGLPYWLTLPAFLALEAGLIVLHQKQARQENPLLPAASQTRAAPPASSRPRP
jgi:hypothetical protein